MSCISLRNRFIDCITLVSHYFYSKGHIMAVGDAHAFLGFLTPVLTQHSFQSHRLLFSHTLAESGGENTPERKFSSTGYRTHNHQVMSLTRSPHESSRSDHHQFSVRTRQILRSSQKPVFKSCMLPGLSHFGSAIKPKSDCIISDLLFLQ